MDAVLNWLWQGALVAIAWWAMLAALERARANVRHIVCWAALLLVVALPVLRALPPAGPSAGASVAMRSDAIVALRQAWWTSTRLMMVAWSMWMGIGAFRFARAIAALRRARTRHRAFPAHVASALPHWNRVRCAGRA